MWQIALIMLIGYMIGSINFSIVVTKYIGKVDIRKIGSGNAGGTNVARAMGWGWGVTVIVIEILKGVIVGLFAKYIFPVDPLGIGSLGAEITGCLAVLAVLVGNIFPCWHGFKGGKGVTTCGAIIAMLDVRVFIVLVSVFLIVFFTSHMVSLGSIIASLGMAPAVAIVYHNSENWIYLCIIVFIMAATLIIRHKENIKRIINGTENKFDFHKKKS